MEIIEENGLKIRVVRTARKKSIVFRVGNDGVPEFLAPKNYPRDELKKAVLENFSRITELILSYEKRESEREKYSLTVNSKLMFLGKKVNISVEKDGYGYDFENFYIPRILEGNELKDRIVEIYKLAAKKYIPERVYETAKRMSLSPNAVKINSARSHWGSCSARGSLNFSWYLMMAEESAVDYVIIHELCHMREFDHSEKFWRDVSKYCPDYEDKKLYLKELWKNILSEGW